MQALNLEDFRYTPPPRAAKVKRFANEMAQQEWLNGKLAAHSDTFTTYRSVETLDIFSHGGLIDFVICGALEGQTFAIAIECKHDFGVSKNAAEGFHQAVHYREYSILTDQRLPEEVRYKSPNLAFSGLLINSEDENIHTARLKGMEILMLKFGTGVAHMVPRYREEIILRMGEVFLLRVDGYHGGAQWHKNAANYLFGSRKRAGTRRDATTVAEKTLDFLQ